MHRLWLSGLLFVVACQVIAATPPAEPPPQPKVEQLLAAAARGDASQVEKLLAEGLDVNAKSQHGMTALAIAKIRGYEHVAQLLRKQGADDDLSELTAEQWVDAVLQERTDPDAPGVAVLIARDGEVVYRKGFGLADLAHDISITPQTKFRIGSVTKQFTAAAILKLQEDGQLQVEDSLSKFFPDFPRGDEVTLHHLLTHTSGIHSYTSKPEFMTTVTAGTSPEELIDSFKSDSFDFDPGQKWQYNNSGYFLLGQIIAKVSGKAYGDYLEEAFFEPLGMDDTGVHTATEILKHEARGYSRSEDDYLKALNWDMSRAGAAGALYSTVEDLQRWNEGVFGGRVLSDASLKAALTPVEIADESSIMPHDYGYGWGMDELRGLRRISHGGGLQGFLSVLAWYPEQRLTVAVLHNAAPPHPTAEPNSLAEILAEAFLWEKMKPRPRYEVDPDVDPKIFADYVGRYDYGGLAVLTVEVDEKKIYAQLSGQQRYEIFPSSKSKFFWKVVDAQVEFLRDEDGNVTAARHTQGGQTFEAPKLAKQKVVDLAADQLDRYVGKYRYKGLGVLTIRRQDKQLLAQMTGQPEFPIFAKSETEFFWKVIAAQIKFVADENGNVIKAIHTQGGGTIEAEKIE